MSPKWITHIRTYYSVLGCPSNMSNGFREKCTRFTMWIVHIGTCAWCTCYAFKSFVDELALMEFLDALNFLLYYTFSVATYWLIIYDSYTKQHEERTFWQILSQINEAFHRQSSMRKWSYLIPMIVLLVGDVFLVILSSSLEKTTELLTKIMHGIFLLVFDSRIFFYLLHLKVISFQLQQIESKTKLNRSQINCTGKELKWIHDYSNLVDEMSIRLNAAFGLSHLALFLISFHGSVTYLSFIYRQIHRKFFKFNSGLF